MRRVASTLAQRRRSLVRSIRCDARAPWREQESTAKGRDGNQAVGDPRPRLAPGRGAQPVHGGRDVPSSGPVSVGDLEATTQASPGRAAVHARVASADQRADLDRQVARVVAWATEHGYSVDQVSTEVGSALNGHRRKFLTLLRERTVTTIWSSTGTDSAGSEPSTSRQPSRPKGVA